MVETVIDRLLTDADIRARFALDRLEALAELNLRGFELTPGEFEVFAQTDPCLWFWDGTLSVDPVH
jgi:hypothetical protein